MPVIKSKVLTTGNQGLEQAQKQQARSNIDAAKKLDIASSADPRVGKNILVPGADGEIDISDKSIESIPPAPYPKAARESGQSASLNGILCPRAQYKSDTFYYI